MARRTLVRIRETTIYEHLYTDEQIAHVLGAGNISFLTDDELRDLVDMNEEVETDLQRHGDIAGRVWTIRITD